MKKVLAITVLALAFGMGNVSPAHATLHNGFRYIDGKCGLHKVSRVIPTLHRWHVRIHACAGYEHILLCSPADWPCKRSDWWKFYNPWRWNWTGVLDLGMDTAFTYNSCNLFAAGLVGELPSGGSDSIITVAAGYGCVRGAMAIANDMDQNFGTRR